MPLFIYDETPIGVAVESQPHIGTRLNHVRLEVDEVRGVQRVGLMVREGAVELKVQR